MGRCEYKRRKSWGTPGICKAAEQQGFWVMGQVAKIFQILVAERETSGKIRAPFLQGFLETNR